VTILLLSRKKLGTLFLCLENKNRGN
jgi:hypothetical protein